MKTDKKTSNTFRSFRWRRIRRGFLSGAVFGAIISTGIAAVTIGLPNFIDTSSTVIGGTQQGWAIAISLFWGFLGATGGAIIGSLINLPADRAGKLVIAGIIAVVIAAISLVVNTTFIF